MRKITDGYARQVLGAGTLNLPQGLIDTKKAQLHLIRVIRFKEREVNTKLDQSEKAKAEAVYQDAERYFESKCSRRT